ncbi:uncharacterized protein LOC117108589 [Anneissia japonica]|uniref:uncharacterized protein LOC117108589 n=1 Tax=Anneissia japonica TaxID=1529436 RepID=UPI0014257BD2|nr:uncharacterized protein LOC117108589 [Anneissia japonica]
MLLRDVLKNNYNVKLIKDCHELFEKLYDAGKLHPNNLTIIFELIKCTGHYGLEKQIRADFIPLCPKVCEIEVAEISAFRIKLKDFGHELCKPDLTAIDGLYNMPRRQYEDAWCLIMDLEDKGVIREGGLENFIKKLRKHSLGHAAAKLH